jgi:8-oxo-dGTP diphosphatase
VAEERVIPCVGGVALDDRGRLLLVRRGNPPGEGLWSIPGGRVEAGESDEAAVARELAEETGLAVAVLRPLGTVDRPAPGGGTYRIRDYLVVARTQPAPDPVPGDDAADARWVSGDELADLPVVAGLVDALAEWGVLPD